MTTVGGTASRPSRDFRNDFDLEDPEFGDFYEEITYDLVSECPVAHSTARGGYLVITDYESIRKAAQDPRLSTEQDGVLLDPIGERQPMIPTELDGDRQRGWRRILNPYFTAARVGDYESAIRSVAQDLVDAMPESGPCDLVEEYCGPLPGIVFFREVLGMPEDNLVVLRELANDAVFGSEEKRGPAFAGISTYIDEYLALRRQQPRRDDVVDAILHATIDGEPATEVEQLSCATLVALGGLNTTTAVLAGGAYYFAQHPEQLEAAMADEDSWDRTVEEVLRLYTPVFGVARRATEDVDVSGETLHRGDMVVLGLGAACKDPRVIEDPLDLRSSGPAPRNIAFGLGPHRCIGSHLARLEISIALRHLLARLEGLTLAGEPKFKTGMLRDFVSLPVSYDRRRPMSEA